VLFVGLGAGRRAMETTMTSQAGAAYAVSGSQVAASWIWRQFTGS
jgi:hypothetical protein